MEQDSDTQDITRLLNQASLGDDDAYERVFQAVYKQLHRLAHHVRRGRASETLNTTALVHEAYVKLVPSQRLDWEGRRHFMGVAARAMRQVLVHAAERRMAKKRGSGREDLSLDATEGLQVAGARPEVEPERIVALDAALQRLEAVDERAARVVECRYFAGMSVGETAQALGISEPTVKRDWRGARAWLAREIGG